MKEIMKINFTYFNTLAVEHIYLHPIIEVIKGMFIMYRITTRYLPYIKHSVNVTYDLEKTNA